MEEQIDNSKLKSKACQNPATWKPLIKLSDIKIIVALITNKNKPKVNTVTGIVKNIKIGFKNVFKKAITIATSKDVDKLSTVTPVRNLDNKNTNMVEIIILINRFMK